MDYLKQSGSYDFIKKLLIEKVSMLINQKFTIGRTLATNFDYQVKYRQYQVKLKSSA